MTPVFERPSYTDFRGKTHSVSVIQDEILNLSKRLVHFTFSFTERVHLFLNAPAPVRALYAFLKPKSIINNPCSFSSWENQKLDLFRKLIDQDSI